MIYSVLIKHNLDSMKKRYFIHANNVFSSIILKL